MDVWDEIQLDEHEQAIMEYGKVWGGAWVHLRWRQTC